MTRESFSKKFLYEADGKVFLSTHSPAVRIIAMHGKSIRLGKKIIVEKDDTIILILKHLDQALVSVSKYDGELHEIFFEIISYDNKETDAALIRRIYSDMNTPSIYECYN